MAQYAISKANRFYGNLLRYTNDRMRDSELIRQIIDGRSPNGQTNCNPTNKLITTAAYSTQLNALEILQNTYGSHLH
jgi:hypothetical protein